MSRLKLSVVVPVYNAQNTLSRCVKSITSQTLKELEIILVDDGSKDGSLNLCEELAAEDKRIRVFHKENGGVSSARNLGIEKAEGEYIGFVDSDDYADVNMFELMYEAAVRENAGIAVCGRVRKSAQTEKRYSLNIPQKCISSEEALKYLITDKNFDSACYNKIIRSDIMKENPFPQDIRINEEMMPIFRCIEKSGAVAVVNEILYTVDVSSESATRAGFSEKFLHTLTVAKRLKAAAQNHEGLIIYAEAFETAAAMDIIRRCVTDKSDCSKYAEDIRNYLLCDFGRRFKNPALSKAQRIKLFTLKVGIKPYHALIKIIYNS